MFGWLKSLFAMPRPSGPAQSLRKFSPGEPTIARDGVRVEQESWRINVGSPQTVRLFELAEPGTEQCLLSYRAEIRSEGLQGRAFLEMWCRLPGGGEYFSKGFDQAVSGTIGWAHCEIPFYLKKGQRPDLIKLNLAVEGSGTVWLKNIELLKTPLSS